MGEDIDEVSGPIFSLNFGELLICDSMFLEILNAYVTARDNFIGIAVVTKVESREGGVSRVFVEGGGFVDFIIIDGKVQSWQPDPYTEWSD